MNVSRAPSKIKTFMMNYLHCRLRNVPFPSCLLARSSQFVADKRDQLDRCRFASCWRRKCDPCCLREICVCCMMDRVEIGGPISWLVGILLASCLLIDHNLLLSTFFASWLIGDTWSERDSTRPLIKRRNLCAHLRKRRLSQNARQQNKTLANAN